MRMLRHLLGFIAFLYVVAILPADAQTVTITSPNTVNPSGQPKAVDNVFVRNADGTIATVGGPSDAVTRGGANFVTGQVSVGTTATLIAAARTGRQKIGVTVTSAVQCAFGAAGVTLATGWPLAAVAYVADSWDTSAALYSVCASTATVAYREQY